MSGFQVVSSDSYCLMNTPTLFLHRGLNHVDLGKIYRLYIYIDKGENTALKYIE